MYEICEGRTADVVLSAGISIMVVALEEMIEDHDDLTLVLEQLDSDIFPKIKKLIAADFNAPPDLGGMH